MLVFSPGAKVVENKNGEICTEKKYLTKDGNNAFWNRTLAAIGIVGTVLVRA
jgi:hypothetical protein